MDIYIYNTIGRSASAKLVPDYPAIALSHLLRTKEKSCIVLTVFKEKSAFLRLMKRPQFCQHILHKVHLTLYVTICYNACIPWNHKN